MTRCERSPASSRGTKRTTEKADGYFESIDHTADVALYVRGDSLSSLFSWAARGMFSLITDLPDAAGVSSQEIYLEAADLESLLVSWLRELLLMFEMESKLPVRYEIEEIVPTSLRAQVYQVDFDPAKQVLNRHIKAVTYHGLEVTPTGQGWEATIVFDT